MEVIYRYVLLTYFVLFISVALLGRSYWVYRKTGINALNQSHQDTTLKKLALVFKLQLLMAAMQVADYSLGFNIITAPRLNFYPAYLGGSIGSILLVLAFFIIVTAQQQMNTAWRIEVDSDSQVDLVDVGWFKFSRNPIFLALRISYLAMFLIIPCLWSLLTFLVAEIAFQWQVRKEEFYLTQKYGAAYLSYCAKVRRWL